MIVDNIMVLTGSYSSKPKIDAKPMVSPPPATINNNLSSQKTEIFHELPSLPIIDPKILYHEGSAMPSLERGLSRNKTLDFMTESPGVKIPSAMGGGYSRQGSISTFLAGFPLMKRQNSFDFFDELNRKLLKQDTFNLGSLGANANATLADSQSNKESSGLKIPNPILLKSTDAEELGNLVVPTLSKKSSTVSQQMPEENPSLSRFNSNFSFLYEK